MKIENKDFWEREDIIYSQDKTVGDTSNYEAYLYEKASNYFKEKHIKINNAKVFGVGTGREIHGILKYLSIGRVIS